VLATHDPHLLRTVTGRQIALRAGRLVDARLRPNHGRFHPFYFAPGLREPAAPRPAAVTSSTIAVAVFLFSAFLLLGQNAYRMLLGWAGRGPDSRVREAWLVAGCDRGSARRIEAEPVA
jgi:hypothetical protein